MTWKLTSECDSLHGNSFFNYKLIVFDVKAVSVLRYLDLFFFFRLDNSLATHYRKTHSNAHSNSYPTGSRYSTMETLRLNKVSIIQGLLTFLE